MLLQKHYRSGEPEAGTYKEDSRWVKQSTKRSKSNPPCRNGKLKSTFYFVVLLFLYRVLLGWTAAGWAGFVGGG